jgi:hypothetical protein
MNTEIWAQCSNKADTEENVVSIIGPTQYTKSKSLGKEYEGSTALALLAIIHPPHILTSQDL